MKNLIYILIVAMSFVACKKKDNPSPAKQTSTTTTPPSSTDTTLVKLYYSLNLTPLKTSVNDYVQDTNNVHIYHNTTLLTDHFIAYDPVNVTLGLDLVENCNCNQGVAHQPVSAHHGDSIVIVFDHLEYNMTASVSSGERFLQIYCRIYDQNKTQLTQLNIPDAVAQGTYPNSSDPFIGYGVGMYTSYYWLKGGQYKMVYHIP